jgi:FkbM family methyltransferase
MMGLVDGIAWRWRLFRKRWFLATSFRNGVSLVRAYDRHMPRGRAVCWDGTAIAHRPDLIGLPETLLEVRYEQVYTRGLYTPRAGDRIIDGGPNIGLFSLWIARQAPCRIVAFEPVSRNYEMLLENLGQAGITTVDAKRAGLSGVPGYATMTSSPRSFDHRLVPRRGGAAPEAVPTYSLAQAIAFVGDEVDLCKLDIEGSERDVFEAVEDETLRKVRRFVIEYHDNMRPGTLELLRRRLAPTHDLRVEPNAAATGCCIRAAATWRRDTAVVVVVPEDGKYAERRREHAKGLQRMVRQSADPHTELTT